jgi:GNAT superfamily N-acetyltransferase
VQPENLKKVDAFWAAYFGCSPGEMASGKTLVQSHAALLGYEGVLVFRHGGGCVVSVPATVPEIERAKLRKGTPAGVFDPEFLASVFVVSTDKVSGPAWIGVADRSDYRPVKSQARLLGPGDREALRRLAEGSGELAWKQSRLMEDREPIFGVYGGSEIVAASGYLVMGKTLAYVGVVTHPQYRGRGYAKAAAATAMEHAFDQGLVVMYRSPRAHESAIRLAEFLGLKMYAETYDVDLLEDVF